MADQEENIWLKSPDDLLKMNRNKLFHAITANMENEEIDAKHEFDTLILATNRVFREITDAKFAKINAQIRELQDANSMSFMQLAMDLALGAFGGGVVALVAKSAFGRILKSRLLVGTIRQKIRISEGGLTGPRASQRQKIKRSNLIRKNKDYDYSSKRHHWDISMIKTVNLDPNSWERIFLEKVPEIIGGRVDETIQAHGSLQTFKKHKTQSAADFFSNQITTLTSQRKKVGKDFINLRRELKDKLLNISETDLRELIIPIIEAAKFEKENIDNKISLSDVDTEKVLSQPILIGACFQMVFVPEKILPSNKERSEWLINGPMIIEKARPERVKASSAQKAALTVISKVLLVPKLMKNNDITSFYDHYSGITSPDRPLVEMTKYLNQLKAYARSKNMIVALLKKSFEAINYLSNIHK
jgi:hypothetical protein